MGIKPIHKAIKKFQSVNVVHAERCWSCFLDNDDYFIANIKNDVAENEDYFKMLAFQKSSLSPADLVRQKSLL